MQDSKQINIWAREALSLMTRHDIPVTPEYYKVWYTYVSKPQGRLHEAVEELFANGVAVDARQCSLLYEKYCGGDNAEAVARFKGEFVRILRIILDEIRKMVQHTNGYGSLIEESAEKLADNNLSIEEVRELVADLLEETRRMGGLGKLISERLDETTRELAVIKQNLKQARAEAMNDFLTGLPNRMAFDATLEKEMAKADEKERPLCILMIDIDFFKKFNDTYGHLAGDEVLKFVASSIKELVRGGDFTARFGGEEFVVLLPFTMLEGARAVGENIRSFFDRAKLKSRKGQLLGKVTVSIGGACMHNGETAEEFVQRADKALYYAKNNGRNMVAVDQLYNA